MSAVREDLGYTGHTASVVDLEEARQRYRQQFVREAWHTNNPETVARLIVEQREAIKAGKAKLRERITGGTYAP